ncbi:MAG: hypothetical protein KA248_12250 [Kiritimatiellae bacterium]|nr:hypothetical protein [Kiritimatiellia bacterium]
MTHKYSCDDAATDMEAVRKCCGYGDPSAAVAFAEIVDRLVADLAPSEFARQPQVVAFVFTGLFSLRDWVFNSHYRPSTDKARKVFRSFDGELRLRLSQCNAGGSYSEPDNVDPFALWDFYHNEFLPVVAALRSTGDAKTSLDFLSRE